MEFYSLVQHHELFTFVSSLEGFTKLLLALQNQCGIKNVYSHTDFVTSRELTKVNHS